MINQENLVEFIKRKIKLSDIENEQIIILMGIKRSTFYYKLKKGQFSMWEFLMLSKILNIDLNYLRDNLDTQ